MTWDRARQRCLQQGGDLAIVDSEIKRRTIGKHLTEIDNFFPDVNIRAFIGIRKFDRWHWLGGRSILGDIWHHGYPLTSGAGRKCGLLDKRSLKWKLSQTKCNYELGFICESNDSKYIFMINILYDSFCMSTS